MIISIDIGNTTIGFAYFINGEISFKLKLETNINYYEDTYFLNYKNLLSAKEVAINDIEGIIISSVVPQLTRTIASLMKKIYHIEPLVVGPGVKTGLGFKVDNPSEVGADLVCVSVGGLKKYQPPFVIADFGTVTKIIYIDENSFFSGVSFMPGLTMSRDVLDLKTAQLLSVSLEKPKSVLGKNTIDAIMSGLIIGSSQSVKGLVELIEKEKKKNVIRILTGGNAVFVSDNLRETDFIYDEDLIHVGLYEIYMKNGKK